MQIWKYLLWYWLYLFFKTSKYVNSYFFTFFKPGESTGHSPMQLRSSSWFACSNLWCGYKNSISVPSSLLSPLFSQCSSVPVMVSHLYNFVFYSSPLVLHSYLFSLLSLVSFLLPHIFLPPHFYALFNPLLFLCCICIFSCTFILCHFLVKPVTTVFLPSCSQVHDTYQFLKFISLAIFYPKSCW